MLDEINIDCIKPNLNVDYPGHRRLCGCNTCYHYRRGYILIQHNERCGEWIKHNKF